MSLRSSIKADVNAIFMNEDEFAEPIVYHFRRGGSRSVSAVIDREPPQVFDAAGNVATPKYVVTIAQDCNDGVKASEVDTGGDEITLLKEFGGVKTEKVTVEVLVSQDMGAIELALR